MSASGQYMRSIKPNILAIKTQMSPKNKYKTIMSHKKDVIIFNTQKHLSVK